MKAYWIALYIKIKNEDNLKKYSEVAIPILKKYGGVPLVRGGCKGGGGCESGNVVGAWWECGGSLRAMLYRPFKKGHYVTFAKGTSKRTHSIVLVREHIL